MSNNQMVSVPRELVEFAVGFKRNGHKNLTDQRSDQDNAQDKLRVLLSQPAEQPRGEPVGEVVAFGEGLHEIAWAAGRMPKLGAKLYTHAGPAEVERLREEVEKQRRLKMHVAENLQNALDNCSVYRAQLAEQHALLQLGLTMLNRGIVSFDDQIEYRQKLADLSASAEPQVKS